MAGASLAGIDRKLDKLDDRVEALENTYERVRRAMWALTLAIVGPFCATVFGTVGVLLLRHWKIT